MKQKFKWNTWKWKWESSCIKYKYFRSIKTEGRDIVRHIQESRKEADFNVDDRIEISIEWAEDILNTFGKYIETETLSQLLQDVKNPDLQKEVEIEDLKIILKLKKIIPLGNYFFYSFIVLVSPSWGTTTFTLCHTFFMASSIFLQIKFFFHLHEWARLMLIF